MQQNINLKKQQVYNQRHQSNAERLQSFTDQSKQSQSSIIDNTQPILIKKQQLVDFTKKFAKEKIKYQQRIAILTQQRNLLNSKMLQLSQSIQQLKEDNRKLQQYMVNIKQRHQQQLIQLKGINQSKGVENQDNYQLMSYRIRQLQQCLNYQKNQNIRYQQFLKIKQQIIKNLEWQKSMKEKQFITTDINNTNAYFSNDKPKHKSIVIKKTNKKNTQTQQSQFCALSNKYQIDQLRHQIKILSQEKDDLDRMVKDISNQNYQLKGTIEILSIDLEYVKNQMILQKKRISYPNISDDHKTIRQLQSTINIKNQHIQALTAEIKKLKQRQISQKKQSMNSISISSSSKKKKIQQNLQLKMFRQKCLILETQIELLQKKLIQNDTLKMRSNSAMNSDRRYSRHKAIQDYLDKNCSRQQDAKNIGKMLAEVSRFN